MEGGGSRGVGGAFSDLQPDEAARAAARELRLEPRDERAHGERRARRGHAVLLLLKRGVARRRTHRELPPARRAGQHARRGARRRVRRRVLLAAARELGRRAKEHGLVARGAVAQQRRVVAAVDAVGAAADVPRVAHHELEVLVVVDDGADARVVVDKLGARDLAVVLAADVERLEELGRDRVGRHAARDHLGVRARVVARRDVRGVRTLRSAEPSGPRMLDGMLRLGGSADVPQRGAAPPQPGRGQTTPIGVET